MPKVPYIANHSRWKSFTVAELNCNSQKNFCGWTIVLHGQGLLHKLFHWKNFTALINPQKPRNFSTSNDLQYTVCEESLKGRGPLTSHNHFIQLYRTVDTPFLNIISYTYFMCCHTRYNLVTPNPKIIGSGETQYNFIH